MRRTIRLARSHGVAVGAHPGFPDLLGFGRREMQMSPQDVEDLVLYQVADWPALPGAKASSSRCEGARRALQHGVPGRSPGRGHRPGGGGVRSTPALFGLPLALIQAASTPACRWQPKRSPTAPTTPTAPWCRAAFRGRHPRPGHASWRAPSPWPASARSRWWTDRASRSRPTRCVSTATHRRGRAGDCHSPGAERRGREDRPLTR